MNYVTSPKFAALEGMRSCLDASLAARFRCALGCPIQMPDWVPAWLPQVEGMRLRAEANELRAKEMPEYLAWKKMELIANAATMRAEAAELQVAGIRPTLNS